MISHFSSWIFQQAISVVGRAGYAGIVLLTALNSSCVPIPSEIFLPFSGYLVSLGRFRFLGVVFSGMAGDLLGSTFIYTFAKMGGEAIFTGRFARFLPLNPDHVNQAKAFYWRFGPIAVSLGKVIPFLRTFISVPAGLFEMSFLPFVFSTLAGGLIWNTALVALGLFLGSHWNLARHYVSHFGFFVIFFLLAAGVAYSVWKKQT